MDCDTAVLPVVLVECPISAMGSAIGGGNAVMGVDDCCVGDLQCLCHRLLEFLVAT